MDRTIKKFVLNEESRDAIRIQLADDGLLMDFPVLESAVAKLGVTNIVRMASVLRGYAEEQTMLPGGGVLVDVEHRMANCDADGNYTTTARGAYCISIADVSKAVNNSVVSTKTANLSVNDSYALMMVLERVVPILALGI